MSEHSLTVLLCVGLVEVLFKVLLPPGIMTNRRHFVDLTDEEKKFLAIVHALNTIVYPVIKDEFNIQCPDNELEKIRTEIYVHQPTRRSKGSRNDKNTSQKTNLYLTQKQREQLLSPIKEEARNLDLKLMIYILRRKNEEEGKTDYVDQLEVINTIRREIFQSSSGVLNEYKFQEILKLIKKVFENRGRGILR
ncbi:unnamed protein product [Mytilus coruscus]|uniref:DZIP3-like HEPN domain-containing protein n=1 Tax=Mytilus coruscus TaxID=42192 RepID=A0A6J8EW62_MYTCO|nr:unnamed protein product [Mytilus coruscus]